MGGARETVIEKVRGRANRSTRADSPMVDGGRKVLLAQQTRWLGVNRKMKKSLLEFEEGQ